MGKTKLLTRLTSGVLAVAVTTGGLLVADVANAAVSPGSLGTVTITPPIGTDNDAPVAHTSAGCSDPGSTAYELRIAGPIDAPPAQQVFNPDFPIAHNQTAGFSKTDPFDIYFGLTFRDAAGQRGKTIIPGEYLLTVNCLDDFSNVGGTFTTSVTFTDATHYTSTPTPTPTATATPTTTTTPTVTPFPHPTPTPPAGTTSTATTLHLTPNPGFTFIPEILIAQVSPVNAPGTVQFFDRSTALGVPVPATGGFALLITLLPKGRHSLAAVFTPTDVQAFALSTSSPMSLTVNALFRVR